MSTLRLTPGDIAGARFAVSRVVEIAQSLRALQHDPTGLHRGWARTTRELLAAHPELDISVLAALVPPTGFLADVMLGALDGPLGSIHEELDAVRGMDSSILVRDIAALRIKAPGRGRLVDETIDDLEHDPAAGLARLAEAMRGYWEVVLEPHWSSIDRILQADITQRSRIHAREGLPALLPQLSPRVALVDDTLHLQAPCWDEVDLTAGRGLVFTPSIFCHPRGMVAMEPPLVSAVVYQALGSGQAWSRHGREDDQGLERVLGRSRAQLLRMLAIPSTTTELAAQACLSQATVNGHLSLLCGAGLVERDRQGREVIYRRTPTAHALIAPSTTAIRPLTAPAAPVAQRHRFLEIDVFGDRLLGGNPLAVVDDASLLTDEQMAQLARWTGFSETTFLLPPTDPRADYRVRIFTPTTEYPSPGTPRWGVPGPGWRATTRRAPGAPSSSSARPDW